jgi:hypothetical protein
VNRLEVVEAKEGTYSIHELEAMLGIEPDESSVIGTSMHVSRGNVSLASTLIKKKLNEKAKSVERSQDDLEVP